MSYGLTVNGFIKKPYSVIKSEYDADLQVLFGENIDLAPDQPLGQWVGIRALRDYQLWELMEEVYNSRSPDRATGTSLDFIASENNLTRIPAIATTVQDVVIKAEIGTTITAGKRIKNPRNTFEFTLDNAVELLTTSCMYAEVEFATFTIGETYTITINGTGVSVVAITDEDSTWALMKTALESAFSFLSCVVLDEILYITGSAIFSISIDLLSEFGLIGNWGNFTCSITGNIPAPANSLTEIVTPVSGWDSVSNPTAGISGREVETDSEFRLRRLVNIAGSGAGTEEAIRSAILNDVAGINGCTIFSNRTELTDSDSRPPHSFEVIVSGGDNDDIAEKIWSKQPAGILSFGNITVNITDSQGFIQPISFTRPVSKYLWVKVQRSLYSEETYPANGDDQIKTNIVNWSLSTNNINIGKDVIRQRLSVPIYQVSGIEDINVLLAVTDNPGDSPTYAEVNIEIASRNIAVFDITRIVVEDLV